MSIKLIKQHNSPQFLADIRKVNEVMVRAPHTGAIFRVKKSEVLREAQEQKIHYEITDKVYVRRRDVMVIK